VTPDRHHALWSGSVYAGDRSAWGFDRGGERAMQISRPRDLGPLVLVVGLFLILFVVSLVVGAR
jgi:hypothetical protein